MPIVADHMQRDVVIIRPDQPITELERVLVNEHVTAVPVVDGDRVVGIVSRFDLVRQIEIERSRFESAAADHLDSFDVEAPTTAPVNVPEAVAARWVRLHVSDVMSVDVLAVPPDATLQKAATLMVGRGVHRLVVMDGDDLVGLISSLDILREVARSGVKSGDEEYPSAIPA